ncbi:MAG: hypothetical protein A3F73_06990 [Gallionellales bacterium RIFCSPLOWO2_12_FULL_59_22]|nr:MAG: hypothetical protein A3H99_03890 [Gallionellales bacterium RIFCSPLOWO2_02_FULL_59_110]OGT02301.1 MAG: hypothetical protein A2Z65_02365 [Gallionellales bacterium RIFCSPLOWO2_02_58_13]OGT14142.1 MAG: hypothetical protein A3F73_06990 [Gallionellales bacterium RIFCSPLOWO2_12_FULL_59_22]
MAIHADNNLRAALHSVYVAIFNAKQTCPEGFRDNDTTRLLTALMGSKPWSWKVVGVTPEALDLFKQNNFKRPPRLIQRGHKINRVETARQLFDRPTPIMLDEFIHIFLKNDETVLMTAEQNRKKDFPNYIPINNSNAELFPSGSLVGWQHRQVEIDFLRHLYANQEVDLQS